MNKLLRPKNLPWFTVGAGGLGLVLQRWLFAGIDHKGLLPAHHPAAAITFLLTALVLAVLFLCARQLPPVSKYSRLYPAGIGRAIGCIAGAVGILSGGISFLGTVGALGIVTFVISIITAVCMLFLALIRFKGGRPAMALHTAMTVFFMLFLVCNCRTWGSEPQVLVYIFPLFACVFLMLSAYYMTVASVRKGNRVWLVFANQCALFFSCLSLTGANWLFYLSMVIYLALDLCSVSTASQQGEA